MNPRSDGPNNEFMPFIYFKDYRQKKELNVGQDLITWQISGYKHLIHFLDKFA